MCNYFFAGGDARSRIRIRGASSSDRSGLSTSSPWIDAHEQMIIMIIIINMIIKTIIMKIRRAGS